MSVALVAAGGEAADADASRLETAFNNTLHIIYDDGRIGRMWLDRDGRYRGQGDRPSSGAWRLRGDRLCFTQRRPIPIPIPFCTRMIDNPHVGARWAARSVTGENIIIEIVRGR